MRLVAQGFSQAYGIDYFKTYAPITKLTAYCVIFALAALDQWEILGMDVITAYLLVKLDEEIYMGDIDMKHYQGMVGSIMYAMLCTCPK